MAGLKPFPSFCYGLRYGGRFRKRFQVINYWAGSRGLDRYLEIGIRFGRCMDRVICKQKIGVDPKPMVNRPDWDIRSVTSDAFFAGNDRRFQIIFVDGLHMAEQVVRDVYNSLAVLDAPGVVFMHDCNPASELAQQRDESLIEKGTWNGDTWKALAFLRQNEPGLFIRTLDLDHGIGVVIPRDYAKVPKLTPEIEARAAKFFDTVSYADLDANRAKMVGLIAGRAELERDLTAENVPATP